MLRSVRLISRTLSGMVSGPRCCRPASLHQFLFYFSPPLTQSSQQPRLVSSSNLVSEKYTLIYAFPAIRGLRALSRLKLAQTGLTLVLLPAVSYFYMQNQASLTMLTYTAGIAAFAAIMLYTMSYYACRVVGMMYVDSTYTTLKVAHLSFWGHRREFHLPVSDVMTLGDVGDSPQEMILRLKRYSCSDTLYFSTRFGHVINKPVFERVFGAR